MSHSRRIRWGLLLPLALSLAGCAKECGTDPNVRIATLRGEARPPIQHVSLSALNGTLNHAADVDATGRFEFGVTRADLDALKGVHFFHLQAPAAIKDGEAWIISAQFVPRQDLGIPTLALWSPAVTVDRTADGGLRIRFDAVPDRDYQPVREYLIQLEFQGIRLDPKRERHEELRRATAQAHPGENLIRPEKLKELLRGRSQEPVRIGVEAQGDASPIALRYHAGVVIVNLPLGE